MKKLLIWLGLLGAWTAPAAITVTPGGGGSDSNTVYEIALVAANTVGGATNGITQATASAMMADGTNSFAGDGSGLTSVTASNLSGTVYLVSGGTQTQYDTIEAAADASVPFDEVRVSGYHNVSNNVVIKSNVRMNLAGAYVVNWIQDLGTNGPAFVLTGTNASLTGPGVIYNAWRELGSNDTTGFSYQASFGVLESGLGTSRLGYGGATNFLVANITSYGETDVAFFRSTNLCSGIIRDSSFDTRWDALLVAEGAHRLTFQNVNIRAIGTNQIAGNQGRAYSATFDTAPGAYVDWVNCSLIVSNATGLVLNSDTGGATTNRFVNCYFENQNTSATEDFVVDGGVGASLYFDKCTGLRPSFVSDLFAGGGTIHYGNIVATKLLFGGDALSGDGPSVTNAGTAVYVVGGLSTSGVLSANLDGGTNLPVTGIDATGTPSGATYLRGDGAWATPAGGPSSDSYIFTNAAAGGLRFTNEFGLGAFVTGGTASFLTSTGLVTTVSAANTAVYGSQYISYSGIHGIDLATGFTLLDATDNPALQPQSRVLNGNWNAQGNLDVDGDLNVDGTMTVTDLIVTNLYTDITNATGLGTDADGKIVATATGGGGSGGMFAIRVTPSSTAAVPRFFSISAGAGGLAVEEQASIPVAAGTLTNLFIKTDGLGASTNLTITVFTNGVASGLEASIVGAGATKIYAYNTSNFCAVTNGTPISLRILVDCTSAPAAAVSASAFLQLVQ